MTGRDFWFWAGGMATMLVIVALREEFERWLWKRRNRDRT